LSFEDYSGFDHLVQIILECQNWS